MRATVTLNAYSFSRPPRRRPPRPPTTDSVLERDGRSRSDSLMAKKEGTRQRRRQGEEAEDHPRGRGRAAARPRLRSRAQADEEQLGTPRGCARCATAAAAPGEPLTAATARTVARRAGLVRQADGVRRRRHDPAARRGLRRPRQLVSFSLFEAKDPFVPQVRRRHARAGRPAPHAVARLRRPSSAATAPIVSGAVPETGSPAPAAARPAAAPTYATIKMNGKAAAARGEGRVPEGRPALRPRSLKPKQAKIGVAGGSFDERARRSRCRRARR